MANAADFASWAQTDLVIPFGGREYRVPPPTVEASKKLIACAVRAEVNLGLRKGEIPEGVQRVLDNIGPDEHVGLGPVYDEMVDAGLSQVTIDRFTYYAVFYWARGEEYADTLARALFAPRDLPEGEVGGAAPKDSSPRRTGRRTASASQTRTGGTRTTGRSRKN